MIYSYDPTKVYLTSQLPTFTIQSADEAIRIELVRDSTVVFATTLYTYNTYARLRDLRSVIEQDMQDLLHSAAYYTIKLIEKSGTFTVAAFMAIHCSVALNVDTATYLLNHFLTTAQSKQITRVCESLSYFTTKSESSSPWALVVYRDASGSVRSYNTSEHSGDSSKFSCRPAVSSVAGTLYYIDVDPSKFSSIGTILAITVYVGSRSFTYYYTEGLPSLSLYYANPFNVLELCQINGVTTRKYEVERSEAVIHRTTSFYDQSTLAFREFQSAPLPFEMADHLSEIAHSHQVRIVDREYTDTDELPLILITDSSIEPSDEQASLSSVKFTYRYDDDVPHLSVASSPGQPFVETYALPYT